MTWPRTRALLIALAMLVGIIDGLPLPEGAGVERLSPGLRRSAELGSAVRATLLRPFRALADLLVVSQRWALFRSAKEGRHRLWLEGRRGARHWTILYRPHDAEHQWFAEGLQYRRVRAAWNKGRSGGGPGYEAFAAWISKRLLRERPDLSAVRVRLEQIDILPRGGGVHATHRFVLSIVHERGEYR